MTFEPSQSSLRDAISPLGELDATNGSGLSGFYTSISFPSSSEQMPL